MKKQTILSKLAALAAVVSVIGAMSASTFAASSDSFCVNYNPHVPSMYSNQTDTATVSYYSDGYKAYCSSYSGVNGSQVTVTSSSAGGMNKTIIITSTGYTPVWKMRISTSGNVTFTLTARTDYSVYASGTISINS
ncbi:MAG: hypothetical protein IJL60_02550 [Clostridiales bacterium]|nr:hypothetical protein [Clostridiales bacterium]